MNVILQFQHYFNMTLYHKHDKDHINITSGEKMALSLLQNVLVCVTTVQLVVIAKHAETHTGGCSIKALVRRSNAEVSIDMTFDL